MAVKGPEKSFLDSILDFFREIAEAFMSLFRQDPSPKPPEQTYSPVRTIKSVFTAARGGLDTIRASLSDGIRSAEQALHGTRYVFGGKGANGIDCAGFVGKAVREAFNRVHDATGITLASNSLAGATSQGQLTALLNMASQNALNNNELETNLHGGMVIAMDTGDHGWDRGRKNGIDHIVATYESGGNVYIAESAGGIGVRRTLASEWLRQMKSKYHTKLRLYGVDLATVAQNAQHDGRNYEMT